MAALARFTVKMVVSNKCEEVALLSEEKRKGLEINNKSEEKRNNDMEFDFGDDELVLFEKPKWYKEYLFHIVIGFAILTIIIVRTFFFNVFIISGESMLPTMENFELALINKIDKPSSYERGDIIIFKGEEKYVKRIIGLSGDTITIEDNKVFINGEEVDETYLNMDMHHVMSDLKNVVVPDDSFFVMGDNRGNSMDSRNGLGLPTSTDIIGKVVVHAKFPITFKK